MTATAIKYDALFTPFLTLTVEERDGEVSVVGAEVDWSDTFRNMWTTGADAEEIIASEYNSDDHAASKEACAFLDAFITEGGKDRTEAQSRSNTAALLRRLAELVEQGNPTKEDS